MARSKSKSKVGSVKNTRTFNGKRYTQSSCSKTKAAAKKAAAAKRKKGFLVRVVDKCLFVRKK